MEQLLLGPPSLSLSRGQANFPHGGWSNGLGLIAPLSTNVGHNGSDLVVVKLGSKPRHHLSLALLSLKKDSDQGAIGSLDPLRGDQRFLHSLAASQMTVAAFGAVLLFADLQ